MLLGKKRLSRKGFTMVELLAAITILGIVTLIAIKGVSGLIDRAKTERVVQQQKTLIIAAESYVQANSQYKPKSIGESKLINVNDLKKANYLKSDIVNADGESCMDKSVVRVYKLSKMEYSYYPYIYCGDEEVPDTIEPPKPFASVYFTDASGKSYADDDWAVLDDVSKARLAINIYGSDYHTSSDNDIAIDGYNYSIVAHDSSGTRTVYDSGSLSANRKSEISILFDLKDYVDFTGQTDFFVRVFVRNVHGGEYSAENPIDNPGIRGSFNDRTDPKCAEIQNQASEGEWINKYSTVKERTITAICEDGDGSGCVRDTFSRTWPNNSQKSAEYGYIRVRDNAGNNNPESNNYLIESCDPGSMCCARVNVDLVSPTISLSALKYNGTKSYGQNILSSSVSNVPDPETGSDSVTINTSNLSGSVNDWINLQNYTGGVAFEVTVSDDIGIASWKWETNPADIWNVNDPEIGSLSLANEDASYRNIDNNSRIKSLDSFEIKMTGSGRRKGVLTVRDIAGNESQVVVYLNIDLISPPDVSSTTNPSLKLYKYREADNENIGDPYVDGEWSNLSVIAVPSDYVLDYVSKNPGATFKYLVYLENSGIPGKSAATAFLDGPYTSRNAYYYFDNSTEPKTNGKNRIALILCTVSGNCTQSKNYDVWIDTVAPDCNVTATTSKGDDYDSTIWLKKGVNAIVTAKCAEKQEGNYSKSGCENTTQWPKEFSFTYDTDVNTTKAGAKGIDTDGNTHGSVRDLAGNVTECPANITVKVDHTDPVCSVSSKLNNSTYNGTSWGKKGDTITVSASCSDTGGDGTGSGCMIYSGTKPTFTSGQTNKSYTYTGNTDTTKATAYGTSKSVSVTDGAGNVVTCPNSTVKLDITPPTCGKSNGAASTASTWRNSSSITVTQECSDTLSGCDTSRNYSKTYTSDITSDSITIYDVAGNSRSCTFYVNRDTVAPSCGTKNSPEPTKAATSRTRSVGCNAGSMAPCSQQTFSRTWTYETDGKVDNDVITISDTAGNKNDCEVAVLVDMESPPSCSDVKNGFGTGITSVTSETINGHPLFNYKLKNANDYNLSKPTAYTVSGVFSETVAGACYASDGGTTHSPPKCAPTYGYPRVCYKDSCGIFKGMTAEEILNDSRYDKATCGGLSKYWCSCCSTNYTIDWFNNGKTYCN